LCQQNWSGRKTKKQEVSEDTSEHKRGHEFNSDCEKNNLQLLGVVIDFIHYSDASGVKLLISAS
jgi:hypothetical protein